MRILLFLIVFFSLSPILKAEIFIEYKVTPLKDNPFLEEWEVLPYKLIVTIGEEYVKVAEVKYVSMGDEFRIFPRNESYYFSCISGYGMNQKMKIERRTYPIVSESETIYSFLGYPCKKVVGKIENYE